MAAASVRYLALRAHMLSLVRTSDYVPSPVEALPCLEALTFGSYPAGPLAEIDQACEGGNFVPFGGVSPA
jgi:hypothetical protein